MRTLSLVDCVELKFNGNIMKEAVALGDVDNDGLFEMVVGTCEGELYVYKGERCVGKAYELGCVAAVGVGDLLNIGRNVVVVITTEGYCHLFLAEEVFKCGQGQGQEGPKLLQQFHSQRIVANCKAMFLADVNDDGLIELVVGLTDRVLRTYKWNPEPVPELLVENQNNPDFVPTVFDGRMQAVNKWELTNQIGSIAPHSQENLISIIIGTGGGTVTRITELSEASLSRIHPEQFRFTEPTLTVGSVGCRLERNDSMEKEIQIGNMKDSSTSSHGENISIKRYPLNSSRMRNQNISTHVAGNIASHDGKNFDSYAVGTWDGTVMICRDDNIEWNLQLNKPVMTVQSFAGSSIFVDMEGPTYLINRRIDKQMQNCVMRFYFEDQVAAFRVGWYGLFNEDQPDTICNQKCFVYATFQGSIYVYPNEFL